MSRSSLSGSVQIDIDLADIAHALDKDDWSRLLASRGMAPIDQLAMQEASDRWRRRDIVGALYALEMILPIEFRGWVNDIEKHYRGRA
jgi:hypothetical protein